MKDQMKAHRIFVYGSLRRDNAGAMSVRFPNARFVSSAHVNGSLYDLGAYPGLLLNESQTTVVGEVYEVDDETLRELDQFELSSDYFRKSVEICIGTERTDGWIYVPEYGPDFYSGLTLITSGDWVKYARDRTESTAE